MTLATLTHSRATRAAFNNHTRPSHTPITNEMCQVCDYSTTNPFQMQPASKKRSRTRTPSPTPHVTCPTMDVDPKHYNLRIKRARTNDSQSMKSYNQSITDANSNRLHANATTSVGHNLSTEVKAMQQKVRELQDQVSSAVRGISELKRLVSHLAQQRMLERQQSHTTAAAC